MFYKCLVWFGRLVFIVGTRTTNAYNSFFNHWHCVAFTRDLDHRRPHAVRVGDLPLIIWRDNADKLHSALNICPHMGSRLDNGKILSNGCLQCQYHGLELKGTTHQYGEIVDFQDRIHWSWRPQNPSPHTIPFFENPDYAKTTIQIDMDASLNDCAYNTMDILHPELIHGGLFGFGNSQPAQNIREFNYSKDKTVGLEFEYASNQMMRLLHSAKTTHNFHMYFYPTFTWSKVSFLKNNLIIGVNLLPISPQKTRWFVTVAHNYYTDETGKMIINGLARKILFDDWLQMKNQAPDSYIKRSRLFRHVFANEGVIMRLRDLFREYRYPDEAEIEKMENNNYSLFSENGNDGYDPFPRK